jgi:hypothetical protein
VLSNLAEAVGYACIVAFLYLMWAPLALLGTGLLIVLWANTRRPRPGRLAGAVATAMGAASAAWRAASAEVDRAKT